MLLCRQKKNARPESWEIHFIGGIIEGCILGKFLVSSEELFQRGEGGARIYGSFG